MHTDPTRPPILPYPSLKHMINEVYSAAANWFTERAAVTTSKHPHILAHPDDWKLNLILPEVYAYIQDEIAASKMNQRCPFALNAGIRNGASSQAMGFNLIGPLITRNDLDPLREVVTNAGIAWPTQARASLEFESRIVFNERRGQPTSIDLVIRNGDDNEGMVAIEIKCTESGFGTCSVHGKGNCDIHGANPLADRNQCYLYRKGYTYWQHMETYSLLTDTLRNGAPCPLAYDYQFFREILFARYHNGSFVLLHDARNPIFTGTAKSLWPRLHAGLPPDVQTRATAITVQQIVAAIRATKRHDDWLGLFETKYGLSHDHSG